MWGVGSSGCRDGHWTSQSPGARPRLSREHAGGTDPQTEGLGVLAPRVRPRDATPCQTHPFGDGRLSLQAVRCLGGAFPVPEDRRGLLPVAGNRVARSRAAPGHAEGASRRTHVFSALLAFA